MSERLAARRENLVVVDDDSDMLRLITSVVERSLSDRLNVVGFCDPALAWSWIQENSCEILVSDIDMPEIDGLQFLELLKGRNPWTQVILVTGHSSWLRVSEAIQKGANDYLLKPLDRTQLLCVIEQAHSRYVRWQSAVGATFAALEEPYKVPLNAQTAAPTAAVSDC